MITHTWTAGLLLTALMLGAIPATGQDIPQPDVILCGGDTEEGTPDDEACVFAGCKTHSGSGKGGITFDNYETNEELYLSSGDWADGCGGNYNDDSVTGVWGCEVTEDCEADEDGAGGTFTVMELGKGQGQSCNASGHPGGLIRMDAGYVKPWHDEDAQTGAQNAVNFGCGSDNPDLDQAFSGYMDDWGSAILADLT